MLTQQVLALGLGLSGWYLAWRFRLPAATIVGPMLLVGAAAALGIARVDFPDWVKTALQIVVGVFLGYSIDRDVVARIRLMLKPVALATTWILASALLIGYMLAALTRMDLATAFLGTSPGGIAEMSAMAMASRANVALVATLQLFRIVVTTFAIPLLAKSALVQRSIAAPDNNLAKVQHPSRHSSRAIGKSSSRFAWFAWLVLGAAGSCGFAWLKIPAAGVIGALVAVGSARASGLDIARPPLALRTAAQVGLGVLIGAAFDGQALAQLRREFLVVALVTAATVVSSLGLAGIVQRLLRVDPQTALLACAPAGLSQMGIIADELGAEVFVVNMFQLARLVCAVLVLPLLFRLLL